MAVHDTWTYNPPLPKRRWSRPYAITLSDTLTDRNLQKNNFPYRFLHNIGTAGAVAIVWEPDNTEVSIYLNQGDVIEGGHWVHAKTTGTGAGVVLRGFLGVEGIGLA